MHTRMHAILYNVGYGALITCTCLALALASLSISPNQTLTYPFSSPCPCPSPKLLYGRTLDSVKQLINYAQNRQWARKRKARARAGAIGLRYGLALILPYALALPFVQRVADFVLN